MMKKGKAAMMRKNKKRMASDEVFEGMEDKMTTDMLHKLIQKKKSMQ